MGDFQIKRGLKQNLFDINGNLLIAPEEGCWYITTDTFELYACFNGVLTLVNAAVSDFAEQLKQLEDKVDSKIQKYGYRSSLPTKGEENVIYLVMAEKAEYCWDEETQQYYCIGRDYREIQFIHGGKA
jgi:hypothetical protein